MAKYTSIGGQALIEGIMMRSPEKSAMAVRKPDKTIAIKMLSQKSLREKSAFFRLPIIRGVISFAESLVGGYKAMMDSAEISGFTDLEEEPKSGENETQKEPSDEKKDEEKKNGGLMALIGIVASVLGVALAVVLFLYIPSLCADGINYLTGKKLPDVAKLGIEQGIKLIVLVVYMWAVSLMKDIKRVFMYHGAEHKTIFCYEAGLPLTVENVKKQKRFHPRCGTSFLILMILVSFIVSALITVLVKDARANRVLWVCIKLLLVPVICGLGFEVLRFCGKYDNAFTKIVSAPGLWMQRITTKEPEDDMMEIAIAALKAAEPEVPDVDRSVDKEQQDKEEQNGQNDI